MSLMDDYKKFRSQLVNAVNATLQNDMIDPIVIAMIDSAERRVYDVYTPIPDGYERRETDDGLKDPMNYKFYSGDMEVGVENVTKGNSAYDDTDGWDPGYIADIIESGHGYHWKHSRIYTQALARPFMQPGMEDFVNSGDADTYLANGLKKRGFIVDGR